MQYKIGQKFKALQSYVSVFHAFAFKTGDIIEIVELDNGNGLTKIMNTKNGNTVTWSTGSLYPPYMKYIIEPPKTEIEWLDRVKENFKW